MQKHFKNAAAAATMLIAASTAAITPAKAFGHGAPADVVKKLELVVQGLPESREKLKFMGRLIGLQGQIESCRANPHATQEEEAAMEQQLQALVEELNSDLQTAGVTTGYSNDIAGTEPTPSLDDALVR